MLWLIAHLWDCTCLKTFGPCSGACMQRFPALLIVISHRLSSPFVILPQVRSMAAMYGFSAQCTAVGTSYFARLAARDARWPP